MPELQKYKTARVPTYRKIEQDLRIKIKSGQWAAGAMLPSRKALAKEYGVDLRTLQEAIVYLLADGTLRADARRGTFVSEKAAPSRPRSLGAAASPPAQTFLGSIATTCTLGIIGGDHPLPPNTRWTYAEVAGTQPEWTQLILRGLEVTFSRAGGTTRFLSRYDADDQNPQISIAQAVRILMNQGVSAIAVANVNAQTRVAEEIMASVDLRAVPVVILSWDDLSGGVPYVTYDSHYAGYQAAKHLIEQGYQRLAFLDPFRQWWSRERLGGAQAAARDAGLPAEAFTVWPAAAGSGEVADPNSDPGPNWYSRESSGEAVGQEAIAGGLFASDDDTLGIVAANDAVARGFLKAAQVAGKIPGRDFGLVGFDDTPEARGLGLTSLHPPLEEMGEEAARLLACALQGQEIPQRVSLRSRLIARASTARKEAT